MVRMALFLLALPYLVHGAQRPYVATPSTPDDATASPTAYAETLVSVLSASNRHATFLHLLQRAKAIPMLSHMTAGTVFAPTDEAWATWADAHRPPDDSDTLHAGWLGSAGLDELRLSDDEATAAWMREYDADEASARAAVDNQNWALRQHLLYHMLNYTLKYSDVAVGSKPDRANVSTETTLLFPMLERPPLPPTPPPGPPWLPRGDEGLLGGHGQRLRWARAGSAEGGERGKVGTDWKGADGVTVWDGAGWNVTRTNETAKEPDGVRWARNGLVVGVDGILEPPGSIEDIIKATPSLSYLSRLMSGEQLPEPIPSLHTTPHVTLFAPDDAAWGVLDDVERRYLEGGYGTEGTSRILAAGLVLGYDNDTVGWRDSFSKKSETAGVNLTVSAPLNGSLMVNGTEVETVDVFASNGVIHIVPHLLVQPNFTLLNSVEKVLLSVNATRFVSLLRSANISSDYLAAPPNNDQDDKAWTFLAPTDDVIDVMERRGAGWPIPQVFDTWAAWLEPTMPATHVPLGVASVDGTGEPVETSLEIKDASPLAALLQYHILPGRLAPSAIRDGMLVGTEMRTSALNGGRQRLRIDVSDRLADRRDWEVATGEIRFGDASVLGPPVRSGKSIIYLVSTLLSPPLDVLQTAVSDLQLSTYVAAVYAAELDRTVRRSPATTYFVPRNQAFSHLGLAMNYLLLPEGKDELRKVLKYHAVGKVVFTADVEDGKEVLKTLEGGDVVLEREPTQRNRTSHLWLRSPTRWPGFDAGAGGGSADGRPGLPANGELRPAQITHADSLTETGTIHTLDSVVLPADVHISIAKLMRGAKHSTMAELMTRAGLAWILDGREPSATEVSRVKLDGLVRGYEVDDDAGRGKGDRTVDDPTGPLPPDEVDTLAFPSYTVLVPTDKAFTRANISEFLSDDDKLLNLLKLHIIPTQPMAMLEGGKARPVASTAPPRDGMPLALGDDLVYATLLSASSKYGELAVRATGDNGFIIGVRNARAGSGFDAARTGASGRASVRWRNPSSMLTATDASGAAAGALRTGPGNELWSGGMTLGGGVIVVDTVLIPYEPSWAMQWGPLVLLIAGASVLLLLGGVSWAWWYRTRAKDEYEALEGEEDE